MISYFLLENLKLNDEKNEFKMEGCYFIPFLLFGISVEEYYNLLITNKNILKKKIKHFETLKHSQFYGIKDINVFSLLFTCDKSCFSTNLYFYLDYKNYIKISFVKHLHHFSSINLLFDL